MNLLRITLIASALLLGTAHAAEISMAEGKLNFSMLVSWVEIMATQGDPEAHVFQVPDPSATGLNSVARITVTVKQLPDTSSFQNYMGEAAAKAMALQGYQAASAPRVANSNLYSAQENGVKNNYSEQFWFKGSYAIQLRCVRPSQSQAGAAWANAFDKGCDALALQLH